MATSSFLNQYIALKSLSNAASNWSFSARCSLLNDDATDSSTFIGLGSRVLVADVLCAADGPWSFTECSFNRRHPWVHHVLPPLPSGLCSKHHHQKTRTFSSRTCYSSHGWSHKPHTNVWDSVLVVCKMVNLIVICKHLIYPNSSDTLC